MATTQLTHIVYPNGDTSNSIPFIVGTGTTAGTWLGTLEGLTAYYDGLLILYKPSIAGASTTTLNLNSLGAKTCYINNTTKLTTHFPANQPVLLVYSASQNSGCWMCIDDYWTNSNTIGEYAGACKAGTNGMARYSLIMKTKQTGNDETWESLVTTSSTATTKAKNTRGFIVGSPILYQSGNTYAKDEISATSGCWSTAYNIDTRYSCNVSSTWSATGRPFFIKGTIAADGLFYLADTTWWSDAYPTTNDGFYYIYVGQMGSAYLLTLHPYHPIFYFDTSLKVLVAGSVQDAQTVNGHTVNADVPSDAAFTDFNVTQIETSTDADYEILFTSASDDSIKTEPIYKNNNFLINPSTGLLKIKSESPNTKLQNNLYNLSTSSSNGITVNNTLLGSMQFSDSNNNNFGAFGAYGNADGSIDFSISCSNMKTTGDIVSNAFRLRTAKNGKLSYIIGNPSGFREAIGIPYEVITSDLATDKNLASGINLVSLHSFTLQPGLWFIQCGAGFAANATGRRLMALSVNGTSSMGYLYQDARPAINGIMTWCQVSTTYYATAATTVYVLGYQNSGSTLSTKVRTQLIRLSTS